MDTLWSGIGSVTAALIGAAALLAANVYAKHREAKEKAAQEIRVKKTDIYEELIELIFNQLSAAKQGRKQLSQNELVKALSRMMPKVVVWASPTVITHWNYIKRTADDSRNTVETLAVWDKLLLLIREDLGHNDKTLSKYELSRLFVNDLDDHIAVHSKAQIKAPTT